MASVLTLPPAVLPVALADMKLYLRVDHEQEDALITALMRAATAAVEAMAGVRLMTQGWSVFADDWPGRSTLCLPLAPVISIGEVRVHADGDTHALIDPAHYYLDAASRPARLVLRPDRIWPRPGRLANGIEVQLLAGFGATPEEVPGELVQAVRSLTAHWYEHREAASGPAMAAIPMGVSALVSTHREVRL